MAGLFAFWSPMGKANQHTWQPGQSGNPAGLAKRAKRFYAALDRAIIQEDGERLRKAADALLDAAAAGESWAIGMLADRLDGKPAQEIDVDASVTQATVSDQPLTADEWTAQYASGLATAAGTTESTD